MIGSGKKRPSEWQRTLKGSWDHWLSKNWVTKINVSCHPESFYFPFGTSTYLKCKWGKSKGEGSSQEARLKPELPSHLQSANKYPPLAWYQDRSANETAIRGYPPTIEYCQRLACCPLHTTRFRSRLLSRSAIKPSATCAFHCNPDKGYIIRWEMGILLA